MRGQFALPAPGPEPAAFATERDGRVVAWNAAAARLFGRSEELALRRHCWDLVRGRDPFGNRYCHERCAVRVMLGRGEDVSPFQLAVPSLPGPARPLSVRVSCVPFARNGSGLGSHLVVHEARPVDGVSAQPVAPADLPGELRGELTRREQQILGWVAEGLQNKEIALAAHISPATVRNHVHNLLEKLGLHSKLSVVCVAFRRGWVSANGRDERAPRDCRQDAVPIADADPRPLHAQAART